MHGCDEVALKLIKTQAVNSVQHSQHQKEVRALVT